MTSGQKLPAWRLVSGIAVLGCLLLVVSVIAPIYVANYQLDQYVRALASGPDAAQTSDDRFRSEIVEHARQLKLPVTPRDVIVKHSSGRLQLQVLNFKAQVYHADLHFSGITTQ